VQAHRGTHVTLVDFQAIDLDTEADTSAAAMITVVRPPNAVETI